MSSKALFALSVALALAFGSSADAQVRAPSQDSTDTQSEPSPPPAEVAARFTVLKNYLTDLGAARHIDWDSLSKLKTAGAGAAGPGFLQAQRQALRARVVTLSAFADVLGTASLSYKLRQMIADRQDSVRNDLFGTNALLDYLGADDTQPSQQSLDNLSELAGAMNRSSGSEIAQGFFLLTILSLRPKEPGSGDKARLIFTRAQCNQLIAVARATGPDGDGLAQFFSSQNVKAADE